MLKVDKKDNEAVFCVFDQKSEDTLQVYLDDVFRYFSLNFSAGKS